MLNQQKAVERLILDPCAVKAEVVRPGPRMGRGRHALVVVCAVVGGAGLLSACSSTPSPNAAGSVSTACQQLSGVLSDGPDPGADPVGYAEAQVLPLRQIHTSNKALGDAIGDLADAYQQFSSTNGATSAKRAVSRATDMVNAICPGAAS
jgi:hypothetical protein